ncbi:hypothetical protein [Affinirhizobium pseudoryzae]|uniref:hypothetical protein n=1 Tax=Allorhizobium pseudoryzae TaxID=379684 RepID=UPI0013ED17FC|nr:hypothetical protein [Allorhizobium pseudoryzae]
MSDSTAYAFCVFAGNITDALVKSGALTPAAARAVFAEVADRRDSLADEDAANLTQYFSYGSTEFWPEEAR